MDRRVTATAGAAIVVALVVLAAGATPATPVERVAAQADGEDTPGETVDCSFPVTATDATGTDVTVEAEPDRIVALAPSAAQQLWAIGARDRVVGMPVNQYTAYLDDRSNVTNVVGSEDGQPIQEAVVSLEPDLVLAPNVITNDTVASLRNAGLTVYRYGEARSIEDVAEEVERTGLLVGEYAAAANESADVRGTVEAIRTAVEGREPPRVYYDLGGGWTAGENTFVGDLIETAGGENVAAAAGIDGYAEISQEVVADADPEVLVVHEGAEIPDTPAIQNSTAVREDNVVRVEANYINQPGPRNVLPLREMARAFHPDAIAAADVANATGPVPATCASADEQPTATDAATATGTQTTAGSPVDGQGAGTDGTGTDRAETDGGTGPGFGPVGAILALVGSLGVIGRRH